MRFLRDYLDDIFYWLGVALITIGAYLVYPVAALFVAGAFCLHFSFLIGKARVNQRSDVGHQTSAIGDGE